MTNSWDCSIQNGVQFWVDVEKLNCTAQHLETSEANCPHLNLHSSGRYQKLSLFLGVVHIVRYAGGMRACDWKTWAQEFQQEERVEPPRDKWWFTHQHLLKTDKIVAWNDPYINIQQFVFNHLFPFQLLLAPDIVHLSPVAPASFRQALLVGIILHCRIT